MRDVVNPIFDVKDILMEVNPPFDLLSVNPQQLDNLIIYEPLRTSLFVEELSVEGIHNCNFEDVREGIFTDKATIFFSNFFVFYCMQKLIN